MEVAPHHKHYNDYTVDAIYYTLFRLFALLPQLTVFTLFILFELFFTDSTIAYMPIYIVMRLLFKRAIGIWFYVLWRIGDWVMDDTP